MKKYYFLMALAATAIMSACSTENEFTPQTSGEKVSFFVDNGPISRTSVNTETAATTFVENDQIGIFATGGATGSNVGYKVGAGTDGALSPIGSDIEWSSTGAGNFYAYYPYAAGSMTDKVTFTVTDQNTEEAFNKNDFMVATAAITNKGAIKFKFGHGLSLVQVVLSGSKAADATEVTLTAKPTVEWTFANSTLTPSGDAKVIKMWKIADDAQTYWAMIPAQTIATTAFVNITAGGKNYTYTPSSAITLTTAKSKKFNLQLGEAGQAISVSTEMNTDGWAPDSEETGNTEEEQYKPIELISEADGKFTAETNLTVQTGKQNCVEGWNYNMPEANGTVVFDETEQALAITKTGGFWHNATIYYCTAEGKATKAIYELKFKMKSSAGSDIQIAVMPCLEANNYFPRAGVTNTYVYQTITTDYVEYTFKFDLSRVQETANATETTAPTTEQINKVLVYFTPKTTTSGATFYIKDVTFIEVTE